MMELKKKDTKMIQGLSVLAMVWLHLFDTLDYEGVFRPLLFLKGIPFAFYIAQLSDFCVMGFAFCSGYAHYKTFAEKNYYKKRLHSLLRLFVRYWTVLLVFTVISILVGESGYMPGSFKTFVLHFLFLDSGYNGAWWYLFAYVVIVLVSPLLLKCVKKRPLWIVAIIGGALYCASYYYRFHYSSANLFLNKIGPLGMTIVEYLMGAAAAKVLYFSTAKRIWNELSKPVRVILSSALVVVMLLTRTLLVPSLFVAPATGLVIITLFCIWKKPDWLERVFLFIGDNSTHIWLTHMFFYLYLFRGFVYCAVCPIPIFMLMIAITTMISVVLNYIEKPVYSLIGI